MSIEYDDSCDDCNIEQESKWTLNSSNCELCGLWDSKLIEGVCKPCTKQYMKIDTNSEEQK